MVAVKLKRGYVGIFLFLEKITSVGPKMLQPETHHNKLPATVSQILILYIKYSIKHVINIM
jgi:hypothetical protein